MARVRLGAGWNPPTPHAHIYIFPLAKAYRQHATETVCCRRAADSCPPPPAHIYQSVKGNIWTRGGQGRVKDVLQGDC